MRLFLRHSLAFAVLVTVAAPATQTQAQQDFPNRPIRLIVAFAAGGNTDLVARLVADKAKAFLGQSVIIENKPGANGAIAADLVAKSDPDGYTLFYSTAGAVAINPSMRSDLPYDPAKDFAPVGLVARNTVIVAVHPATGIKSANDLVARAKAQPGKFTIGITGVGAISHLAIELFKAQAGIKLLHVPYRGTGPAVTDLIGGRIDLMFAPGPVVQQFVQSGQLKALGVTDTQRSKFYPDVPTVADAVPGYESVGWFGLLAPPNTPPEIVKNKLNAAFTGIVADAEVKRKLIENGVTPLSSTPDEFSAFIASETRRWAKVVRDNGIKGEQ